MVARGPGPGSSTPCHGRELIQPGKPGTRTRSTSALTRVACATIRTPHAVMTRLHFYLPLLQPCDVGLVAPSQHSQLRLSVRLIVPGFAAAAAVGSI